MNIIYKGPLFVKKNRANSVIIMLFLLTAASFLISVILGRYSISIGQIIQIIICKVSGSPIPASIDCNMDTILFQVRLPRILSAVLIGAGLSISGATYQGMFRNPMVSPDILGASAGAGFGAAIGILMSFGSIGIEITSFLFGILAVGLSYFASKVISRGSNAIVLVLTGMVVSTLFQSLISLTKYVADPYSKMPAITFWLMGGLSTISPDDTKILFAVILAAAMPLMLIRWKINVISFGEEEAMALGINISKIRILLVICSTLITAACVSVSGMIGWVGLIVPHFARMLVGPNYKILLPASCLIGCTYLLVVDDIARSVFPMEIPLGILTSFIGTPFFMYLLLKGKKGWA
ncbi:MAG: iron ABC transporter permease [Anaerocolumna sp.]